jgi:murein endopeptidase
VTIPFRLVAIGAALAALGALALVPSRAAPEEPDPSIQPILWHPSQAVGRPYAGRLVGGVQLPAEGEQFFTWDPILERSPNRDWRRYGTDRLVRTILRVLEQYRGLHPDAPRVGIGDLSRPHGGDFGRRYGRPGHASHQNGLDVDVYYPRLDGAERRAFSPKAIDLPLAQDLLRLFVRERVQYVFIGPRVPLEGPRRVVQHLRRHDDHMHVRMRRR